LLPENLDEPPKERDLRDLALLARNGTGMLAPLPAKPRFRPGSLAARILGSLRQ